MSNEFVLDNRKQYQRNKMLYVIRSNENVSRNDVKKITAYSMTTVLNTIDEMIHDELLYEEQCNDVRIGRRPVWLRVNAQGGYFIGVEFNRHRVECAVLDFTGKQIFDCEQIIDKQHKNTESVLELIKLSIHKALDFLGEKQKKGIGLGIPGYSDRRYCCN